MSKGSLQAFLGSECGPSPRPACGHALLARGTDACLLRATGQQWARGPWSGPGLALWRDSQRGVPGWVEGGRLRPRVWHQPLNGVCMDPAQPPVSPAPTGPSVLPSLPRSSLPRAVPGAAVPAAALVGGTVLAPSHRWGAGGTEGCHREDAGPLTAGPAPARRPRGPGPEPARPAGLRLPGGRGHELPGGAACRAPGPGRSEHARGRHPGLQGGRLRPGPAAQGRRGLRPPALPRAASRWEGRAPLSPPRHCCPSPG